MITALTAAFTQAQAAVDSVSTPLSGIGLQLLSVLALICLLWRGQEWMFSSDITEVLGGWVRSTLFLSFAFFLLQGGQNNQPALLGFVGGLTDDVVTLLAGQSGLAGLATAGMTIFNAQIMGIASIFSGIFNDANMLTVIGKLLQMLMPILILLIALLVLMAGAAVFFIMGLAGLVMTKLAVVLAPLFIPFIVLPWTSFLWEGWLRFYVSASLYKVVAAGLLNIGNQILSATIAGTVASIHPGDVIDASSMGNLMIAAEITFAVAATIFYLMLQVPHIASGLVGGHAGINHSLRLPYLRHWFRNSGGGNAPPPTTPPAPPLTPKK